MKFGIWNVSVKKGTRNTVLITNRESAWEHDNYTQFWDNYGKTEDNYKIGNME